jgi:GH25 family lysozyme M1 (1,4-beta-N-acetylmuramidase)
MRLSNGNVLFSWPLAAHVITAGWTYNDGSAHNAIDLRAAFKTPVYAAEDGTVTQTQIWDGVTKTGMQSYGVMCCVKHADYKGGELCTRYAHLTKLCVKRGEKVKEGQLIGFSGATGNCYGAHLHFEVLYKGNRVNPLNWLDGDFTVKDAQTGAHLGKYNSVTPPGKTGIFGIDVSKYQGAIDWAKVAAAGVKFAIVRVGSCDNGGPYVDPTFETNYAGAKAAGIKVGAYFYTYAKTQDAQDAELAVWLPALEGKTFDYPVFVDVEQQGVTTDLVKRGMDILDQRGFVAGWYSYTNFMPNLDPATLSDYPLWLADYRSAPGYKGDIVMWQYTSKGKVDGIDGNVDCNWGYRDYTADKSSTAPAQQDPKPAAKMQHVKVTFDDPEDGAQLGRLLATLRVPLEATVSNGDAYSIMRVAQTLGAEYKSEYVGG